MQQRRRLQPGKLVPSTVTGRRHTRTHTHVYPPTHPHTHTHTRTHAHTRTRSLRPCRPVGVADVPTSGERVAAFVSDAYVPHTQPTPYCCFFCVVWVYPTEVSPIACSMVKCNATIANLLSGTTWVRSKTPKAQMEMAHPWRYIPLKWRMGSYKKVSSGRG